MQDVIISPKPECVQFSVVVPVYNEGCNIGAFCRKALNELPPDFELIICYDFDEDNTLPAVASLSSSEKPPLTRCVKNELGPGVRYAIEAGMRAARGQVVVVMMADLSDDFGCVEDMFRRATAGAAVVCASRYMRGGRQIGGPLLKKILSRGAGLSLHWIVGLPTHDVTNSLKAYRKDFLDSQIVESKKGFCLGMELTVKAHFGGRRIEEIPATWHDRTAGESRFQVWNWLPHYLQWYAWALVRSRRAAFLGIGFVAFLAILLVLATSKLVQAHG
jgi:dolichol-phosphate mannosyltransferase